MIAIPAICDKCDTIFPSGIVGGNSTIILTNNKSGPCPNCGSMGSIPDGTYKLTQNIIELLSAPERTIRELRRLSILVEKTIKEELTTEELAEEVKNDTPSLISLLDWIVPKTSEKKFAFGLTMLSTALNIFIPLMLSGKPVVNITPEVIIQHNYDVHNNFDYNKECLNNIEKVERNKPCPCGSGMKYKKCHGK